MQSAFADYGGRCARCKGRLTSVVLLLERYAQPRCALRTEAPRMSTLSLIPEISDKKIRQRAVKRLRELNVTLPTLSELADPTRISATQQAILATVGADDPVAANLWRVHWFNDES